jgi:hypothetical protein
MVFGGAIGSYIRNKNSKTEKGFPMINYDLVLISLPMLMGGALIGV